MNRFSLSFGGIGLILLVIGGFVYTREANFLKTAAIVTGTVVDLDYSSSSDGGGSYCPVIDFNTKAGEPVRYYGNVCTSPPSYDIGERIEVVYDPADIRHVQMNNFWSQYVGVLVLGGVGAIFFLIGLWAVFAGGSKNG